MTCTTKRPSRRKRIPRVRAPCGSTSAGAQLRRRKTSVAAMSLMIADSVDPTRTANFATASPSPRGKARLLMNMAIVKPMPAETSEHEHGACTDAPRQLAQSQPGHDEGRQTDAERLAEDQTAPTPRRDAFERRFARSRGPSKLTPAFASANNGMITYATHG